MRANLDNYEKFKELHEINHLYGYLLWKYGTDNNIEIEDIGVSIKRKGYGRALIKSLIDNLKGNPPKIIFLYTKEKNKSARAFYEMVGFQKGGQMGDNLLYFQFYEKIKP